MCRKGGSEMTEAIGNQITQLRLKGLGYKSIALVKNGINSCTATEKNFLAIRRKKYDTDSMIVKSAVLSAKRMKLLKKPERGPQKD